MRKLMLFTIGFCAVCAVYAYFYFSWMWLICVLAVILTVILKTALRNNRWTQMLAVVLVGCAVGSGWSCLLDHFYMKPAGMLDGHTCDVKITVTDYSYETDYGSASDGIIYLESKPYAVRFYLKESINLKPGDVATGSFRLRLTIAGGQDEPTYHRGEGTFLLLYEKDGVDIAQLNETPWYCYPTVWRQNLLNNLHLLFPDDVVGFVQALLLGARENLDYETQTALKISGIQHVVAVSGLHVSILCGLLYTLTLRKRYLTFFVCTPLLLLFAAVVGFTPSITRACIMHILMLLAQVADKEYDPPTELAFSVLVMVFMNPMAVTSVSLQLSVGCMIGILFLYPKIRAWILNEKRFGSAKGKSIIPRLRRWFSSSVSVTLSAMIITTPMVAYHFGAVSLIGVVTNLLTLWCIVLVFYGIIGCLLLQILNITVAKFFAEMIAWLVRYVLSIAKICSGLPFSAVYTQSVYVVFWIIAFYVLLAAFFLIKNKHPVILILCSAVLLCLSLAASWLEPRLYSCYATFLDVGQGQCIILQSNGATFLVDCGGSSDTEAADLAAETLLSRGITRVDGVIVTHYDRDHAGGVPYLLSRIEAEHVYLPEIADDVGIKSQLSEMAGDRAVAVSEDVTIPIPEGNIILLGPIAYDLGNESSLCVLFETESCDILITGDRGELGEMLLLKEHTLPKLEVLVAGHHGSAGSTSERLLAATNPEVVVISVSERNIYGHPAQSLLDRLTEAGCVICRTDQIGTVIYRR